MKRLILFSLFYLLISVSMLAQNVEKKITPAELSQMIVDILEELRLDMQVNDLQFNESELEVVAKKTFEGGAKLSVWIFKAGLDVEKETAVTVTYKLSKLLEEAKQESQMLAFLEKSFNPTIKDPKVQSQNLSELKSLKFQSQEFHGIMESQTFAQATQIVEQVKGRRKRAQKIVKARETFIETVRQSLDDYNSMRAKFGDVSFDVMISFSVGYGPAGEAEIGIFGAEAKRINSWEHSLKISFGKKASEK